MEALKTKSKFVGYEYKDIAVDRDMERMYVDGYANFGWKQEGTGKTRAPHTVMLTFKRDRQLRAKVELTRLQRKFEAIAQNISAMEGNKTSGATALAYGIGFAGTGFIAGAVFAMLAGALPLSILLAIPGLVAWVTSYLSYKQLRKKKTERIGPLIEGKYDEIYKTCEKANALLAA